MPDEVAADDARIPLKDRLKKITAFYDGSDTEDDRRYAGLQMLMEIASALQREGIPERDLRPLTALIHGLDDLDRGVVPLIFQKPRKGGGRTLPFEELRQRGLAAAAVTLFMQEDGVSETQALQKVVDRIKKWRAVKNRRVRKTESGQPLLEALKDWREKAKGGSRKQDGDTMIYFQILELAEQGGNSLPPSHWAELALTAGNDLYR